MSLSHHPDDLIRLFNSCFLESHHTQLAYGQEEPIYLPQSAEQPYHTIFFAHGFFSSALHECAHWLLAGEQRRQLVDYGYWYVPDGRTPEQQAIFQQVEVKPQALEWTLSNACRHPFRLSFDNLNGAAADYEQFSEAVHHQMQIYAREGLPARAQKFHTVLLTYYATVYEFRSDLELEI
jgi:elongation factor P hydroxylase